MMPPGRHAGIVTVFVLALTAAGCLTASQESRVQTDLDEVRKQVFEMQRDTAAMMSKMTSIEEKLAKQDSAQPTRWADMQALLQTLADGVRTLGARLDDNTTRMGSLARDIAATRDQYRALDARIAAALGERSPSQPIAAAAPPPSALEPPQGGSQGAPPQGGSPGVPTQGGSPGVPTQGGSQGAPPQGGSQSATPMGAATSGPQSTPPSGAPTNAGAAGSGQAGTAASGSPSGTAPPLHSAVDQASLSAGESAQEEVFRSAYSDYTRGNYEAALTGFQGYLGRYPSSSLAAGALYYSGECLFNQQKYQEAADAFGKAVADHPNMDNAAASYLKRGLSLLALKQTAQGVVQLQHVIDSYPRSEEARIAADRLRQLGLRDR